MPQELEEMFLGAAGKGVYSSDGNLTWFSRFPSPVAGGEGGASPNPLRVQAE